jgi:hypothetical protein
LPCTGEFNLVKSRNIFLIGEELARADWSIDLSTSGILLVLLAARIGEGGIFLTGVATLIVEASQALSRRRRLIFAAIGDGWELASETFSSNFIAVARDLF